MKNKKTNKKSSKNKALKATAQNTPKVKKSSRMKLRAYGQGSKLHSWIGMACIPIAIVLYYVTFSFGYVLDDLIVITGNSFTQKGFAGIWEILSTESFSGYFGEQKDLLQGARYRPLSIVTFAMEQSIFNGSPGVSHFINALLYGVNGWLLYRVLHRLFPSKQDRWWWSVAIIGTLIYMVHPIHTEAVANIKGRDEIMTFSLSLATILWLIKWDEKKKWVYAGAACFTFFLGLLSKENAITFLAIIPVIFYVIRRHIFKKSLFLIWPLLLTTVVYLFVRWSVIGYLLEPGKEILDLMNNPFADMNGSQKYATIFFTLWKYIQLSIIPSALTHDYYPYAIPILEWSDIRAWAPFLLYIVLGVMTIYGIWKRKKWSLGLVFFLASLTIVSNIFVGVGTFMNERFIYISSAGSCLLMAMGIKYLGEKFMPYGKYASYALLSILVVGYTWKTLDRNPDWKDSLTLNFSAVKVSTNSARANSFVATAIYNEIKDLPNTPEKKQDLEKAMGYAQKSLDIFPFYLNAHKMKLGIKAKLYEYDNNLDALLIAFGETMQYRPEMNYIKQYLEYLAGRGQDEKLIQFYLEHAYQRMFKSGRNVRFAISYLEQGNTLFPGDGRIKAALIEAYTATGNTAKANALKG